MMQKLDTIEDFSHQWTLFPDNEGFYASMDALESLFSGLLFPDDLRGAKVADIGAGTGRYTRLLHQCGTKSILALEPSRAFPILRKNTSDLDGIEYLQGTAEDMPDDGFEYVFCIGVLQFIENPRPALVAMRRALRPGGKLFLWVYGKENNRVYLSFLSGLRWFSSRMSYNALKRFACVLEVPAWLYSLACKYFPLPLSRYMADYYSRLDRPRRRLVIYDQLNPRHVAFYEQEELRQLLLECGFESIRMHHRLGYSWSVLASRP